MKHPKHPGAWWVSLDDGREVVEVALVHVGFYAFSTSLDDGAYVRFVTEPTRSFEMASLSQDIVQPVRSYASVVGGNAVERGREVCVTWLSEVKPPKTAPKIGDAAKAEDFQA